MRSLIILEVEHGESTDPLDQLRATVVTAAVADTPHLSYVYDEPVSVVNWTVRVDVPECFVLDTGESPCWVGGDCVRMPNGIIHSSECYALIMQDAPKE